MFLLFVFVYFFKEKFLFPDLFFTRTAILNRNFFLYG